MAIQPGQRRDFGARTHLGRQLRLIAANAASLSAFASETGPESPDLAHVGFTAEIPLPNQGFPARFLDIAEALEDVEGLLEKLEHIMSV